MTEETRLKAPVLARLSSDKVFCYLSMALFLALPYLRERRKVSFRHARKEGEHHAEA